MLSSGPQYCIGNKKRNRMQEEKKKMEKKHYIWKKKKECGGKMINTLKEKKTGKQARPHSLE